MPIWGCSKLFIMSLSQFILKLVKIAGIMIVASRTKAKATYVTVLCKNCKNVKMVPCRPGLGGAIVPRLCHLAPQKYLGTLKRSHGVRLVLSMLWSRLACSPTRTRLSPISRAAEKMKPKELESQVPEKDVSKDKH